MTLVDINSERIQAENFALQASILDDLGSNEAAGIYRQLVQLCDLKIQILQSLEQCFLRREAEMERADLDDNSIGLG